MKTVIKITVEELLFKITIIIIIRKNFKTQKFEKGNQLKMGKDLNRHLYQR